MSAYLSIVAMTLSAATAASPPMETIGKWTLDAGANECVLQHAYSANGQTWSVGILPHPGLTRAEILLLPPASFHGGASEDTATATLQPSGKTFPGDVQTAAPDGEGKRMRRIAVDTGLLAALPDATALIIVIRHGPALSLPLPGMPGAAGALKACEAQLLDSWGVDPARFRPIIPAGQPGFVSMAGFLRANDYPEGANDASGKTIALLALGTDGKVADCRVVASSGNAALDQRTCQIALSRVRYPPALGSTGKPVASWTMFPMAWTARH